MDTLRFLTSEASEKKDTLKELEQPKENQSKELWSGETMEEKSYQVMKMVSSPSGIQKMELLYMQ